MILTSILSLVFSLFFPDPQTPNFYPGLASAREASKKGQKEMVIFFTGKDCKNCEAAWVAFTKDVQATNQFVSTRMDVDDFDGGIFFDLLDLKEVPSWIILYPDGTEKERWEGGWKDASGNPTLFVVNPEISKTTPQQKNVVQETKPQSKTNPVTTSKNETVVTAQKAAPTISSSTIQKGFFLQAGYFGSEINAKKMLDDLKLKGFSSFEMKTEEKEGKLFYRVVSKKFATEMEANSEQRKLSSMGVNASMKS